MELGCVARDELRNGLPESAQGFLTFSRSEYYDALSFASDGFPNFYGKALKISGLNHPVRAISLSLEAPSLAAFGVSCAK
jgi:hypothetical protein